jgi:hypothetical protein
MRLVGLYRRVGDFFERLEKASKDFPHSLAPLSLDATISVLQKGRVLLTKYTEADWHKSVMTGGLNQGSFEAIHLELEACIQSVYELLQETVPEIKQFPFMKLEYQGRLIRLLHLDEHDRATLLGEEAEKDRIKMLEKIKVVKMEVTEYKGYLTPEQRFSKIRSLEVASEAIKDRSPATPEELPPALRIKPSEILVLGGIGSGGNGVVHKCRYMQVDYAVKILNTGGEDGLRAEVGKLIKLRHPNIVPLFGFSVGEPPERKPMIVMELLDGDLRLLLRRHPLMLSKAVDVMHQIATGMAYLHKQKIFHGDLKSMNVLLKDADSRFTQVKISDFGVSQQILGTESDDGDDDAVNTRSFSGKVGTPMWMAPEVLTSSGAGNNFYSAKADVYSFAMLCVEILTGEKPYLDDALTLGKIISSVVDEGRRPKLPWAVPTDLRELIVQCWDEKPERRPDFLQICTRLQMLKLTYSPLGWVLHVLLHSNGFLAAIFVVLCLIIFWTFGSF